MNLLEESQESQAFIQAAFANSGGFKRFPNEHFAKIGAAVVATSQLDRQNERMAPEALFSMAEQIQRKSIWLMIEHNPLIPPAGRILTARCFHAPISQVYFVVGILGYYDPAQDAIFSSVGFTMSRRVGRMEFAASAPGAFDLAVSYNPHEIAPSVIDDILREAPPQVSREPKIVGRKSADPIKILSISASMWLLCNNPFVKKFSERLGERAADASIDLASWLKDKVFTAFSKIEKEPLFEFECEELGCNVEFVIPSKNLLVLRKATDAVHDAAESARALLKILEPFGPEKLVYSFDIKSQQWFPLYAATRLRGVIRDARTLVVTERLASSATD